MTYMYVVLGIMVMNFLAGMFAFPDGPDRAFWASWAFFTVVICAVVLPVLAVTS